MFTELFEAFLASDDTLRVYRDDKLIFSSRKDRLLPLLEYLAEDRPEKQPVTIYDRIMGNAAALLAVKANCREVFSPLGSELGTKTLQKHGIKYNLGEVVPCIMRPDGKEICPMERLSIGKTPEEFCREMQSRVAVKK